MASEGRTRFLASQERQRPGGNPPRRHIGLTPVANAPGSPVPPARDVVLLLVGSARSANMEKLRNSTDAGSIFDGHDGCPGRDGVNGRVVLRPRLTGSSAQTILFPKA